MPPLGTKLPAHRPKKPPSCDHCKQKRVLCHPNAAGCPRCVEKGIECTTTPVVRRKPTKRRKVEPSIDGATPSASTSPRASTVDPLDLPVPPAPGQQPSPNYFEGSTSFTPVPSTSTSTRDYTPQETPAFDSFQLMSLHYTPSSLSVSPELARHLFEVFGQTPQHEHPIFAAYTLARTLATLGWNVDLLPSQSMVLAWCIFAIGSLMSYHPSILDPYQLNFGGACPESFPSVLDHLPDLRKFGKLRSAACQAYRDEALRRAKESDILFVASEESATACYILCWLESIFPGGNRPSASIWSAAGISHLRTLRCSSSLPRGDHQMRWACYLLVDSISTLFNAENAPSLADELLLVGATNHDEATVDRQVQARSIESRGGWPEAEAHIVLGLKLSRTISEELVGPWNRDMPFDFAKVSAILTSLERRRRCGWYSVESIDKHLDSLDPPVPIHLFPTFSTRDPTSRVKLDEVTAMRSFRLLIQLCWAYPSLIVYEQLKKKQVGWKASTTSRGPTKSPDRYAKSGLDFCVQESRALALQGFEATIDAFDHLATLAAWTHILPQALERWAHFIVTELSEGLVVVDRNIVTLLDKLSRALKQYGYVWASPSIDSLVLALDSQVLSYELASSTATKNGGQTHGPVSTFDFQSSFDPTLSLFANITAISDNSASPASLGNSPSFGTTSTVDSTAHTSCAPMTTLGVNGMNDFSQTLGFGTFSR